MMGNVQMCTFVLSLSNETEQMQRRAGDGGTDRNDSFINVSDLGRTRPIWTSGTSLDFALPTHTHTSPALPFLILVSLH